MSPARLEPKNKNDNPADMVLTFLNKPLMIKVGLLLALLILMVLLTALVYAVVGVSATESGVYYNQIEKVI